MGIWFGMLLIVGIFTGLYFTYGANQIAMLQGDKVVAAQIFKKCHDAAVAEAHANAALGTAAVTRACSTAAGMGLTNPLAAGLSVADIVLDFQPGTSVGLPSGRVIVTYLPTGGTVNGILFNNVHEQVGNLYHNDPSVGIVVAAGTHYIESVSGMQVTVPATIPAGAIAMVTAINP